MELLCSAVVVGMVVVAGLVAAGLSWSRGERPIERAYRQLARRYHGRFESSGWLSENHPVTQFRYRDVPVRVEAYTEQGHPHTSLTFTWPEAYVGCAIVSRDFGVERFTQGHRSLPIVKILPTRCARDEPCYAVGFHESRLRRLLSVGVIAQVGRLQDLGGGVPLSVVVAPPRLAIHKRATFVTLDDLLELVRLGIELFEQMRLTHSEGLEFVNDGVAQVIDRAECQVCGEQIDHDLVVCRRCKTPHHRDCWEYAGGCSIYGCGEQRYDTP